MAFPYLSDVIYFLTGLRLPLPFATFGIMVALGTLAAAACLRRALRRLHDSGRIGSARRLVKDEHGQRRPAEVPVHTLVGDFTMVVLVAGILGARLFHILENGDMFLQDPWSMIFSRSGLSVFGGLIVGALAGLVLLRRWRVRVRPFLDAIAPIYKSVMALGCFAVLWALRRHPFQAGWLFSAYLLLAGIERLLIEQIRVNVQFEFHGVHFTQAEFIAAGFIVMGTIGMAMLGRRGLPSGLGGTPAAS